MPAAKKVKKSVKKPAKKTKEYREAAKRAYLNELESTGDDIKYAHDDQAELRWGDLTAAAKHKKSSLAKIQLAAAKYRRHMQDAPILKAKRPLYGWTKGEKLKTQAMLTNNIMGMSKPMIRRLCLRSGIKRVSSNVYETVRTNMQAFVDNALDAALVFTRRMKHNTVTQDDIVRGLAAKGVHVSPAVTTQRYTFKKKTSGKKPAAKAESPAA